ncbi:unnamed protein product, partial [marine sediment metagenome]
CDKVLVPSVIVSITGSPTVQLSEPKVVSPWLPAVDTTSCACTAIPDKKKLKHL